MPNLPFGWDVALQRFRRYADGDEARSEIGAFAILSGTGVPSAGLGVDGDFYIDTAANDIYGPKTAGAWGSATDLVGPQGPAGPIGVQHTQWLIPYPVIGDDLILPWDSRAVTIVGIRAGLPGGLATPTVTWNLHHAALLDTPVGSRAKLFTASQTTFTTSAIDDLSPDDDPTIIADQAFSLVVTSQAGNVPWLSLAIEYTVDP